MAKGRNDCAVSKRQFSKNSLLLTNNNHSTTFLRITHHHPPPQHLFTSMSVTSCNKSDAAIGDDENNYQQHRRRRPYQQKNRCKMLSFSGWMPASPNSSFLCHISSSSSKCKKLTSKTFAAFSNLLLITLTLTILLFGTTLTVSAGSFDDFLSDPGDVLKNMVRTFGRELSSAATEQTCLGRIEENFQAYSGEVSYFDGNKMMDDMRQDVINMLNWKRHAVDRIANESERISSNHTFDKNLDNFPFLNVNQPPIEEAGDDGEGDDKEEPIGIKPERLRPSSAAANFDGYEVDLESSAVHIPVNVFHKAVEVINDIKWSDALTPFFKNNLAFDPSLSWQFFGSAKGFLRLYPAFQWREPPNLKVGAEAVGEDGSFQAPPSVDFYDCRMRSWYIQGAASPKDIVILLDTSGSMLGKRRILASDVVSKILDTLTEDDYVAAYQFNKNVTPICNCLDRLVRATKRNILTIKGALTGLKAEHPVNFTGALLEAFTTLQAVNKSGRGSQCNQAIMIVTDGAPSTYQDIFKQFNYPNIPVRVFTYQVGKDVTMNSEMYWMACENRGYFTHVANQAEVHEQVQKYIPVLSRPVVLSGQRIFSWTPVYAPNSKIELTAWNWDNKQKSEFVAHLRATGALGLVAGDQSSMNVDSESPSSDLLESNREHIHDRRQTIDWAHGTAGNIEDDHQLSAAATSDADKGAAFASERSPVHSEPYISPGAYSSKSKKKKQSKCDVTLYTTLSTSVFDTRNYTNITRRRLIKNVYQETEPEQIRIANLLGVAGIDVPIKEIIKLTPPFKLGVNGYVFIISNNGYILYHPDLRPCFEDFLKPFYNSVDLGEIELANNTNGPRDWSGSEIEIIRSNMIERTHGWKKVAVKMHIDDMKRVVTRVNHYTHGWISNTPFSLAIALPEPYGSYRLTSAVDLKMKFRSENFTAYFRGDQWRVHPDWPYCTSPQRPFAAGQGSEDGGGAQRGHGQKMMTPEQVITNFLSVELESNNFRWRTSSIRPQVYDTISCDKDLVQKLVLDAKLTDIPSTKCNTSPNLRDDQRIKTFGIATTFVATRSGLTRFTDYRSADEISRAREGENGEAPFYEEHTRAIEETYYQRAVDFYATHNRDAFVYSVDFDAGAPYAGRAPRAANFLVTATHALFIGNGKQSTPVAVVGIQFRYGVLHEFFLNTTNKFNVPCTHMDMDCYLLDNNGFVLLSGHKVEDVGRFFGEIDGDILTDLVTSNVLRKVHMYDYQAICVKKVGDAVMGPSARPFAFSMANALFSMVSGLFNMLATLYVDLTYLGPWRVFASLFECKEPDPLEQAEAAAANSGPPLVGGVLKEFIQNNMTTAEPCDKEFDLFEMSDFSNVTRSREVACGQSPGCSRKYLAQYVPHTNLLMVMVDNHPGCTCIKSVVDIEPKEIVYNQAEMCAQLREEKSRKRPQSCYSQHPQEKDITQCGAASNLKMNAFAIVLMVLLSTTVFRW